MPTSSESPLQSGTGIPQSVPRQGGRVITLTWTGVAAVALDPSPVGGVVEVHEAAASISDRPATRPPCVLTKVRAVGATDVAEQARHRRSGVSRKALHAKGLAGFLGSRDPGTRSR